MTDRKVLVFPGALGTDHDAQQSALSMLPRYDLAPADFAASVEDALAHLRHGDHDLAIVPVDRVEASTLGAIERLMQGHAGLRVVATASRQDPVLILQALRSGIAEFLVRPVSPGDFSAALDRLTRRTSADTKRGLVIAVYSAKGGLGTTTVAVNLAYQFAKTLSPAHVALVDLVHGHGDIRLALDLHPAYDFEDLAERDAQVDSHVLFSLLTPLRGVWTLPASDTVEAAAAERPEAVARVVAQLRSHFDLAVLDCGSAMDKQAIAAFDVADRILVVTQLTLGPLRATQRALQLFHRLGHEGDKVQVIVNRHHSGDTVSRSEAVTVLDHPIALALPNDYKLCGRALTRGRSVVELEPRSALAASFAPLANLVAPGVAVPQGAGVPAAGRTPSLRRLVGLES